MSERFSTKINERFSTKINERFSTNKIDENIFPKIDPLNGQSHTFLNQLKNRDSELLSYISDRLYEGYNYDDIKIGLDKVLGSRFSKKDVSNDEIQWLKDTCNDAKNINNYQDNK